MHGCKSSHVVRAIKVKSFETDLSASACEHASSCRRVRRPRVHAAQVSVVAVARTWPGVKRVSEERAVRGEEL
eukprot:4796789-Pleurochrysis_carterae.AAC.1